jgi:hypothetical protein
MPDPFAVLLLPERLEDFALAEHARDLLRAPRVVALEPPRVSWARIAGLPAAFALHAAKRQARRLKLQGEPRVVILYDPLQALLAFSLLTRHPGAELWYLRPEAAAPPEPDPALQRRAAELDRLAGKRAKLEIAIGDLAPLPPDRTWFEANERLWDRLEELEIAEFA